MPKTPKVHLVSTIGLFVFGFLLFGAISLGYSQLNMAFRGEKLEGFEALETALEQDERILVATISESPIGFWRGERPIHVTLTIDIWTNHCVTFAVECEDIDVVIAKTAFQEFAYICDYSTLVIKTSNRFDIGFAVPGSGESTLTRPITVWQQEFQDIGRCY